MKKLFFVVLVLVLFIPSIGRCNSLSFGGFLSLSGGTITGNFEVSGNTTLHSNVTDSSLNASTVICTDASKNQVSCTPSVAQGGTGATTMVGAQQALGLTYVVVSSSANQTLPAATAGLRRVYSMETTADYLNIKPASGEKIQFGRTLGAADQVLRSDGLAYATAYCEVVTAGQWNCYDNSGTFAFVP